MATLTALSTLRMASGAFFFASPELAAKTFSMPTAKPVAIVTRMVGARDLAVGALLHTCRRGNNSQVLSRNADAQPNNPELRRALLAAIAIDALDALGYLWCYWEGNLSVDDLKALTGGALLLLSVQIFAFYEAPSQSTHASRK
ncbi:hypothetical protein OIDMADRAFT_60826 [Oidiodendron maius Zn]|uniref:Uncharacterized protein n=1 Tax=Oidiodendron maius (strain Zn) TaxID=913774 RepID=A0A0C3GSZ5_OIDMZ|nr:hypothetical protein OIDMADRAFT_60826 [Oidiodendron maius Zn]